MVWLRAWVTVLYTELMQSTSLSWYLNFTAVNKVTGDCVSVNKSNVSVADWVPHKYHGIYFQSIFNFQYEKTIMTIATVLT